MSTWSGITLVFVPPWITVGANVVCVHEYTTRDRPSGSVAGEIAQLVVLRGGRRGTRAGTACPRRSRATCRRSGSAGRYSCEAPHDLGRRDHGVVGAERLRRVPGRPAHSELRPVRALLVDHHRQAGAHRRRDLEAARLGQHVVGVHRVALVLDQPLGAPRAQRLLVGDGEVGERAARLEAGVGEPPEGERHRGGLVEHVDGAAPPDEPVDDLGAEGIAAPPVGVHRHDVGVPHQQQRRRRSDRCPRCGRRGCCGRVGARSARCRGRRPRGSCRAGRRS